MTILVTGSAGFIGSHLVDALLQLGNTVIGVDDYSAGKPSNLDAAREFGCQFDDRCQDVSDLIPSDLSGVDAIFHLAASKKNVCLKDPVRDLQVNAGNTLHLLRIAEQAGVKKFVHASTGSVYGERVGAITEHSPFNPVSYYGVSKLAGERYVNLFKDRIDTTILRFFHVYGPRQEAKDDRGGVMAIWMRRLLQGKPLIVYGTGYQTRSFTYVEDVVNACLMAWNDIRMTGEVYNVASGIKVTLNDLISDLVEISNIIPSVEYREWQAGDIREFDVSNYKLRTLGFYTRSDFKDGLERTWKWFSGIKWSE